MTISHNLVTNASSWIEAFLSCRQQAVLCDGVKSEYFTVMSGVHQGTVLGPLLFLLHINDMAISCRPWDNCPSVRWWL